MRVRAAVLVVAVILGAAAGADEEGLVAHWSFDEGAGEVVHDLTGNGHDGSIKGAEWVRSPRGWALRFDGADDIVTYAKVDSMNLAGDITLAVWVKTDAGAAPNTNRVIIGDSGSGVQRNFNLRISSYNTIMFEWADGTRNAYLQADDGYLDGAWRHLAVVADSRAMRATMYVDGVPVASTHMPLPISPAPTPGRFSGYWSYGCLEGELDDIRLYHRALSAAEVRALFAGEASVQVGPVRTLFTEGGGQPRAAATCLVRNFTGAAVRAQIERLQLGPEDSGSLGSETVELPAGGQAEVSAGDVALEPIFPGRSELFVAQGQRAKVRLVVSVAHEGFTDRQETTVTPRAYVEPISLQVDDPWQRDMAPGKTEQIRMRVRLQVAEKLRRGGRLQVTLLSRETRGQVAERVIRNPEPETEIEIDARDLPWGAYQVRAALVDAAGAEVGATTGLATVLPEGKQQIVVRNNLCSELMNAAERGLLDAREIEFMNPRDGWCFFSLTGAASVRLEGREQLLLSHGETVEAMRLLPAGRHRLTVSGAPQQVLVRAIPALVYNCFPSQSMIAPFGPNTWERLAQWTLPNTNMIESHSVEHPEARQFVDWGRSWLLNRTAPGLGASEVPGVEEMLDCWRSALGWGTELLSGLQVDEYYPGVKDELLINTARSAALLAADPQFAGRLWIPFVVRMYGSDVAELFMKTTLAAGWPFSIECYIGELPTEAENRAQVQGTLRNEAERWEEAYPGSLRRAIFTIMYAYLPYCTTNRCPTGDFHIHLQTQMQVLATDPIYFGLWGVQPYRSNYVNEDILNCMGALLRHYCIEGSTEPLLSDPYELRHVLNPDFDGTEHWQLEPAEEGSISTDRFAGYGSLQGRYPWTSIGDSFLVMRRSAQRPNVVRQAITGLQPGRLYSVKLITGDHQDLLAGQSRDAACAVRLQVEGAQVQEGAFAHRFYSARGPKPFNVREHPFRMVYHYLQFRATAATAQLSISDWASASEPGGPIGQETMFSFVEVQPVFEGIPEARNRLPGAGGDGGG